MIASSEEESLEIYSRYVANIEQAAPEVASISASIKERLFPGALVISGETTMFAVAPDHLSWRALIPLLEARVAYQLSDLPRPQSLVAAPDELVKLLNGYHPAVWNRIRYPRSLWRMGLVACARLIQNVLDHAHLMEVPDRKPTTAELLNTFETALSRDNVAEADDVLRNLRSGNNLDGLNLRFLQLRLLQARGGSETEVRRICAQIKDLTLPSKVRSIVDQYNK